MPTKRQKQILNFITSFQKKKGFAPSLEEIKKYLKLSSVSTIHFHIKKLQEEGFLNKDENSPRSISVYESQQMVKIPLIGTIAAGQPIEATQEKETIAIPKNKVMRGGNFFALRVAGNSMIGENINDGDVVLVKEQQTAENGQKVVALIDNYEATLKTFYDEKNRIRLQPANKEYEPIIIKKGEQEVIIQGLVVDVIKNEINIDDDKDEKKELGSTKIIDNYHNKIFCEDCFLGLKKIPENSIDACITDPPYNYEFIGHKWNPGEIKRRTDRVIDSKTLVKHIPYGSGLAGGIRNERWYRKNANNIKEYRKWTFNWGKEVYRVLKPGAYILVFNSSRTIAHVQVALEEAGFYARDIIVWKKNSGIPKGLNFSKKLKREGISGSAKWDGWHSCLRNEWEAIALLQKPLIDNYLTTVKSYDIGLMHAKNNDGGFQSNILDNFKRDKKENFNIHCTVKPVSLIKKLIDLVIPRDKNKIVLDPFIGSGTTTIAALDSNIKYLGFEVDKEYCAIVEKRIENYKKELEKRLF